MTPMPEISEDGYWQSVEGEWVPTEDDKEITFQPQKCAACGNSFEFEGTKSRNCLGRNCSNLIGPK